MAQSPQAYNQKDNQRDEAIVLAVARPMVTQVFQTTIAGNNAALGQVLNIPLNNVGLNTRLMVEVSGNIAQAAAETLTRQPWGPATFFTNLQVSDLSNNQRVNTDGKHLHALASLRRRQAFGAAFTNDSPVAFGSNYAVCKAPSSITTVQPFQWFFEVPLAYHEDSDLRGAIFAAVTSATWRLQLTINPNLIVGSGSTDTGNAAYKSSTAGDVGILSGVTIKVYQCYLDQLPRNGNMPVVPLLSLAWNYLLSQTTLTGLVVGNDFPIPFSNFRTFLSTLAEYDNAGTYGNLTDINYWGLQVANLAFIEKMSPQYAALRARNMIGDDPPLGMYVFDHRRYPINTNQVGNTQLVVNPAAASAGASMNIRWEALAVQSQAINAGSLAAS